MDKIRTLDMEVHLGWVAHSAHASPRGQMSEEDRLRFDVGLLSGLREHFRCTGSSMEVLSEEWQKSDIGGECEQCPEPALHAAGGFPVLQFAISFVHPELLLE